jgi:hypothetical protein
MNNGHASLSFLYKKPPPLGMSNQILCPPVASSQVAHSTQIDMPNISESPESPAPPDIHFNINFPPIVPFEEFSAEVDRLIGDMLLHPHGDQLLSDFTQMLGVTIPVDTHDQSTEDAKGSSGGMATADVVHEEGQTNDPVAGDSSPQG